MRWRVLLGFVGMVGCYDTHGTSGVDAGASIDVGDGTRDTPSDGRIIEPPRDAPRDSAGASTEATYVIARFDLPTVRADGSVSCLDLDGVVSRGATDRCDDTPDYVSAETGALGVDCEFNGNVMPLFEGMLDGTYADFYARRLAEGRNLLLFHVTGIDSYVEDDVVVHAFMGRTETGAPPVFTGGRLDANQRFVEIGDLGTADARITGGRLQGRLDGIGAPIGIGSAVSSLVIRQVHFTADIAPSGLTNGVFGGHVLVEDLLSVFIALGLDVDLPLVVSVSRPDLLPDTAGVVCEGVSTGVSFDAVPAVDLGPL